MGRNFIEEDTRLYILTVCITYPLSFGKYLLSTYYEIDIVLST